MANLEAFLQQSAAYVKQTLPGLPAYSKVSRKQIELQVTECLERYRGLALRLENYTPDGSTNGPRNMALLALEGTVPMTYRNKAYNIPVSIRLPQGFPVAPPQCYVLQKNGLVLKPQHTVVMPTGLCNFSRFEKARWDPKRSTMRDQVDQMVLVFGLEPPLFSPSSASTSAAQQALASPKSPPSSLSFHTLVAVATAVANGKGAAAHAWDPKEPTAEELALPLESLVRLLAKLEVEDADSEDATDDAFQSLREEKIKAEEYIKTVRRLAWEQYMKRALAAKAAHLRPFLEQRELQETERRAAERAEQDQREREAERVRAAEQERVRAEEEQRRAEEEVQRAEEERRRREDEQRRQYEQRVVEEQRRIAEQAAARAAQEARDRAEQERLWREEQARQVAELEARNRKQEEDRRLAEELQRKELERKEQERVEWERAELQRKELERQERERKEREQAELERAERARLQQMELQQMQAATTVGGQGGRWPAPGGTYFHPSQAPPQYQSANVGPYSPGYGQGTRPPGEPVPAFPYQPPGQHMPPPQQFPPPAQFPPQFYPGPYGPGPMSNQGPMMLLPPPGQYMQSPPPYIQPQAGGTYMMQGMWPPAPPTGYR